ncbi:hypothetical protein [Saccharothrix sp. HUAS TT1]|uniref:hypothetical protein n=1 Tax=unclassified Saccharothrix TaxID=2593673 RepID=UPI00345B9EEF
MNDEQLTRKMQAAADEAARSARDPVAHRAIWGSVVVLALLVAGLLWGNWLRGSEIERLDQSQRETAQAAQALYDQVRALGGTPAVQPPAPGERGEPGAQGEPGERGRDGVDGQDGTDGTTPPCLAEPGQCRGADGTGVPGQPGTNGADGQPGRDGAPGKDGVDGKDGLDGRDGQPPASWTWVDGDGRTQSCTRNPGSPDNVPTYTCTGEPPTGPPGTTTTTTPPLLPLRR